LRRITKAGEKGIVNIAKLAPLAGGVGGGAVDGASCMGVGKTAKGIFARGLAKENA